MPPEIRVRHAQECPKGDRRGDEAKAEVPRSQRREPQDDVLSHWSIVLSRCLIRWGEKVAGVRISVTAVSTRLSLQVLFPSRWRKAPLMPRIGFSKPFRSLGRRSLLQC